MGTRGSLASRRKDSSRRKIVSLVRDAREHSPFFRQKLAGIENPHPIDAAEFARRVPVTRLDELVAHKIESGDPCSWQSRRSEPLVTFQMEYPAETPLYLSLNRSSLRQYAEALSRCWRILGLGQGDTVAISDYGSSPLAYLASSLFTPYLRRGAAELLGCRPICNDGVGSMSSRAVQIVKFVRPRLLFIRTDALHPFVAELEKQGFGLPGSVEALVVGENEGVVSEGVRESVQGRLGVPVYRLVRVDAAMFLAVECPACGFFHTWPDCYLVEILGEDLLSPRNAGQRGSLAITTRFARVCPVIRFLSQVRGSRVGRGCPRGPEDERLAL